MFVSLVDGKNSTGVDLYQHREVSKDSSMNTAIPVVKDSSIAMYQNYVLCGLQGASQPSSKSVQQYRQYVKLK